MDSPALAAAAAPVLDLASPAAAASLAAAGVGGLAGALVAECGAGLGPAVRAAARAAVAADAPSAAGAMLAAAAAAAEADAADGWMPPAVLTQVGDRLALQASLARYTAAGGGVGSTAAAAAAGLPLGGFDWLGFDVDHTLLAYRQAAVNEALFRATARHLIQHGGHNARSYSVKDSARGSLLLGANLVGNRLAQYRALLAAHLLIDGHLDALSGGGSSSAPGSPAAATATAAPVLSPGQSRYTATPVGAAGHVAAAAASAAAPPPSALSRLSTGALVDFRSILAAAEDPSLSATRAGALPFWGHLARTGAVLDFHRGNVLWVDVAGCVVRGVHGRRVLTERQLRRVYGPTKGPLPLPGVPAPPLSADAAATPASPSSSAASPASPASGATPHGGGLTPHEDASLREAKAKLHAVMALSMPVGPFSGPAAGGASSTAAGGAHGASAGGAGGAAAPGAGYGVVLSGFDESLPPLFALLVARYDGWLRGDPGRRRASEGDMIAEFQREQDEYEAAVAAAAAAAEGGHLPTVEEADDEDGADGDGSLGRRSTLGSSLGAGGRRRALSRAGGSAGSSSGSVTSPSSAAGADAGDVHTGIDDDGDDDGNGDNRPPSRNRSRAVSNAGGAHPSMGSSSRGRDGDGDSDDEDSASSDGYDDYDAFLRDGMRPTHEATRAALAAGRPPRRPASPPVDYAFLAEALQAAHRFVYSGYCSYGFSSLWGSLDTYVDKRPATRAWLAGLRKLPLPLLPALSTSAGAAVDVTSGDAAAAADGGAGAAAAASLALTGRARRLRTFIVTNASWEHLAPALRHAYGADWLDLFDAVFIEARKRTLFGAAAAPATAGAGEGAGFDDDESESHTTNSSGGGSGARGVIGGARGGKAAVPTSAPLRPIDTKTGRMMAPSGRPVLRPVADPAAAGGQALVADLTASKVWTGGSLADIVATLREAAAAPVALGGGSSPTSGAAAGVRVCYVGDHMQQDVAGPATAAGWTTVAVLPALDALAAVVGAEGGAPQQLVAPATGALVDARLLGGPVPTAARERSHAELPHAVADAEYHLLSMGSGPHWARPSLQAAIALRHAALAVPSVEWLARATLPRVTAALAAADKAGASKLPLAPPQSAGSGGGGGSGASASPTANKGAGATPVAVPHAARRALLRAALSLRIAPSELLPLHRVPTPAAVLRTALLAARQPTSGNPLARLLELEPAAAAAAAGAAGGTDARPQLQSVVSAPTLPPLIDSTIGTGVSRLVAADDVAAVEEVPAGGCGCFGGKGKAAKASISGPASAASSTHSASGSRGAAVDASPPLAEAALWLQQTTAAAGGMSGVPPASRAAGSVWPASTPLAELAATGCWFVPRLAASAGADSASSDVGGGWELVCGGLRDDVGLSASAATAPPVWPVLAAAMVAAAAAAQSDSAM